METFENVVLLSSGIDSVVSALIVEKEYGRIPYLITMDMEYNTEEVKKAKEIVNFLGWKDRHIVFNTSSTISGFMVRSNNNFILYRNLFFVMWADNLMVDLDKEYVKYYLGGLREDSVKDGSSQGRKAMQDCLNILREKGEIVVTSCVDSMNKTDLWDYVRVNHGESFMNSLFSMTSSCYVGINCGCCNACCRKFFSGVASGIKNCEETFKNNPVKTSAIEVYVKRIKLGLEKSGMEKMRYLYTKKALQEYGLVEGD